MGGVDSKTLFKEAIQDLANKEQLIAGQGEAYWDRFWSASGLTTDDFFELIPPDEIRNLRDHASGNLTTLCFKLVQRLSLAASTGCTGVNEHTIVLNCVRMLIRIIPFLFEHAQWRDLFWSPIALSEDEGAGSLTLAQTLLSAISDLLFCPDFTVPAKKTTTGREQPVDLGLLDSCEYIWEAGVGCASSLPSTWQMDNHRAKLLQLLVTCCSESLYCSPRDSLPGNKWLDHLVSVNNRHVLPMLVSLLNTICVYNPGGYGIPYYHALLINYREKLVEISAHALMIILDYSAPPVAIPAQTEAPPTSAQQEETVTQRDSVFVDEHHVNTSAENLFKLYISKLHQKADMQFITKGISVLLSSYIKQSYFSMGSKRIGFVQEILVLLWKMMELNKKFLIHLLQSSHLFDIIVPLLCEMLNAKTTPSKVGLLHVGVFIFLVMSGERNFGVRLNKPYNQKLSLDLPSFSGNHADLLFLVLHRIIISGLPRLQPLYDCLLTIISNVSPYIKSLSLLTCTRLIHLLESFSTPWFLCARPNNHFLIFFLLETFNNLIQYQFDGNTNMVYSMIRSKAVFYQLSSLTEETCRIPKSPTQQQAVAMASGIHHNGHTTASSTSSQRPLHQLHHTAEVHTDPSAVATVPDQVEAANNDTTAATRDDSEAFDMPEMNTPSISLEVTETAKDDDTVTTEDHNEVSEGAGSQREDLRKSEAELQSDEEIPTPKPQSDEEVPTPKPQSDEEIPTPKPQSDEEIPTPKPQSDEEIPTPKPQSDVEIPTPKPQSDEEIPTPKLQSEEDIPVPKPQPEDQPKAQNPIPEPQSTLSASISQAQGSRVYPKPLSVRSKPIPAPRSKLPTRKGKLLPLREKLAGNANKLAECFEEREMNFVPTAEWLHHWKSKLPLEPVMKLLEILVPQVDKMCKENDVSSEQSILEYLKNGTLVGLLPVPHPIIVRRYRQNLSTDLWFHTYIWGVIFVRTDAPPIWIDTQLQLFQVQIVDD